MQTLMIENFDLKKFRRKQKLTQKQFADKVSCSLSSIGGIEAGRNKLSMKLFRAIAENFNLSQYALYEKCQHDETPQTEAAKEIDVIDLKKLRKEHNIKTQQNLADKLGFTRSNIAMIESGKCGISPEMLSAITRRFRISRKNLYEKY